jgi:hypothetical protein
VEITGTKITAAIKTIYGKTLMKYEKERW